METVHNAQSIVLCRRGPSIRQKQKNRKPASQTCWDTLVWTVKAARGRGFVYENGSIGAVTACRTNYLPAQAVSIVSVARVIASLEHSGSYASALHRRVGGCAQFVAHYPF